MNDHISGCAWCRQELAAYDALDAAARRHLATVAVAPLTLQDIVRAAETAPAAGMATATRSGRTIEPASPRRRRPHLSTLAPLAAAFALVLLAGLIFAAHRPGTGVASGTPAPTSPSQSANQTPTSPPQAANLMGTAWTLTRLMVDGREQPLVPGRTPTLRFGPHAGQIYGNGSCNGYGGTYTQAGDAFRFSGLYYTQMACMPTGVTQQEEAYFQALPHVERYHLDGNTLTLTSADGGVQLTFRAG